MAFSLAEMEMFGYYPQNEVLAVRAELRECRACRVEGM
jgi:hypothetical protein